MFSWLFGKKKPMDAASDRLHPVTALDKIYPYVVPSGYLEAIGDEPEGLILELGHELYVMLVYDLDGMVRNVKGKEISALGLTPKQAHELAIENLERLAREREVDMKLIPEGPQNKPLMVVADHWAAATCILLPRLYGIARQSMGVADVCVSIPQREVMLLFPKGDRAYRDAMRAMIREKESDARKPLTWGLFTLNEDGVEPFVEGLE